MELCSNCGKKGAERRIVREGRELRLVLCDACFARLYPAQDAGPFNVFGEGERGPRCPACGTTYAEYRATGLLGCADCYSAFREKLMPVIRYMHGSTRHAGVAPSGAAEQNYDLIRGLVRSKDMLLKELKEAEERGDTAAAARIREQVRGIDRKLYGAEVL